ncbi:MAG: flagellar basal body rod protein FlgC [Rubellimicrobium sp.]|nr:flagellar basal body rod protein FlgC [Rubellimicrobium sp.]
MTGFIDALRVSASGMDAQATRLRYLSENIANADTPGYHRKTVSFHAATGRDAPAGAVRPGPMRLDAAEPERIFDPAHPLAGADGYRQGSNVNLLVEIADTREAGRSYEANLRVFDQLRQMSTALLDLLRR